MTCRCGIFGRFPDCWKLCKQKLSCICPKRSWTPFNSISKEECKRESWKSNGADVHRNVRGSDAACHMATGRLQQVQASDVVWVAIRAWIVSTRPRISMQPPKPHERISIDHDLMLTLFRLNACNTEKGCSECLCRGCSVPWLPALAPSHYHRISGL